MSIIRDFTLYLHAGITVPPVVHVNQYDQGEVWRFTLLEEDGSQYTPSSGALIGVKADGHAIAGVTGTVIGDGRVSITETQQMTAAAGKAVFELTIDGGAHGTANFIVQVEPKPTDSAILSDSDLSIIQEGMNSVTPVVIAETVSDWLEDNLTDPPIDPSLTISNAAADAKVTGDKITELKTAIANITKVFPIILKVKNGAFTCSENGVNRYKIGTASLIAGNTYLIRVRGDYDYGLSTQCTLDFARKESTQGDTLYSSFATITWTKPNSGAFEYKTTWTPSGTIGQPWSYDFAIRFLNAVNNANKAGVSNVTLTIIDVTGQTYQNSLDFNRVIDESENAVVFPPVNVYNKNIIDCFGDSMTAGTGGTPYTAELQTLLGNDYTVNNFGVGGETTLSILARMGSMPMKADPFTIPQAAGQAAVSLHSMFGYDFLNIIGGKGANPVIIDGVTGNISVSNDFNTNYFQALSYETTPKAVTRPAVVLSNASYRTPYHTLVLFMGQNGGWTGGDPVGMLIEQYNSAVKFMKSERYLFIGLTSGTADSRSALEIKMASAFGGHYVNARDYLVNYGLTDNEMTPTAEDTAAINEGSVPPSLLSDSVHLNTYGYASLAKCIYQRGKELNYWD